MLYEVKTADGKLDPVYAAGMDAIAKASKMIQITYPVGSAHSEEDKDAWMQGAVVALTALAATYISTKNRIVMREHPGIIDRMVEAGIMAMVQIAKPKGKR